MFNINKKLKQRIEALEDYLSIAYVDEERWGGYYLAEKHGKANMLEEMYKEKEEGVSNIKKLLKNK